MASSNQRSTVEREALAGRLPILSGERVYSTYTSFLWTCCTFSAATWAFLIGGYLPAVGDWRLGAVGYAIGMIIGMAVVTLASGGPTFKYGTDVVDSAKPSMGYRGAVIPLFGLLATLLGWSYVLEALTARGAANVVATITSTSSTSLPHEHLVICVGLVVLVLAWLITVKGPKLFERLNGYVGPLHMLITVLMLGVLVHRYGIGTLWIKQLPAGQMLTHDRLQGMALAVEFGASNAMTWWPVIGGLTRLAKRRRHVVGPTVIGAGILGAAFVSSVAALAAISAGTPDPTIWMISLAGPVLGTIVMSVVLTANVATMVVMMYLSAVSIQQVRILARIRWDVLLALMLTPGIYFAFRTQWLLSEVMTWLSYNGVMFVGIVGITFVDFYFLRKEEIDPAHLFNAYGKYAYWGGVNWVAMLIIALSTWGYLALYDPVTSASSFSFRYMGASFPGVILSGIAYLVAAKFILKPLGKGSYSGSSGTSKASAEGQTGTIKVAL
ncbi:purine-cytosine permease-like protein [Paraburkholderia sp. BL27I4N3]|uniref:cytosine permease n=1 Tax=Paraburkholderia sp. BL27I4N3 TaxID=1938805 RepID=UPI000E27F96A|nr:cytosine permease [Paraburkholderia sp. BL27I4N3]REE18130.1 purine-cytosine permease-like protein [Paraburkholderia sp. BL27I4N3]